MRGRGGPPPFFRGGRGGGPAGRFQGPGNFDQNWGPPPGHFSQGGGGPMVRQLLSLIYILQKLIFFFIDARIMG